MYTRALKQHGYNVEVVADGTVGYERLRHNHYDVILLDLMIPGMKGTEILNRWAEGTHEHTKIVVLTNMTISDHDQVKLSQLADAFLQKAEVIPSQLIERLEALLK